MGVDVIDGLLTVVIFSASSSGISHSNSSSSAITSSTVSRESAPRSSTKEDSILDFSFVHAQLLGNDFLDALFDISM